MIGGINMVVAFTGYRPEKMPFVESKKDEAYLKFRKRQLQVIERLIERGCTHFISGVAMGFDTWVAEDILVLQKNNSSLELECAIPFPGQADRWSTSDQKRRYKILTHATSSVIVCEHYSSNCFFESNKYMVNNNGFCRTFAKLYELLRRHLCHLCRFLSRLSRCFGGFLRCLYCFLRGRCRIFRYLLGGLNRFTCRLCRVARSDLPEPETPVIKLLPFSSSPRLTMIIFLLIALLAK